jgi:hypothetical protein
MRLLPLALLALLPAAALAGPWTPEPGGGYAKAGLTFLPGVGLFRGPEAVEADGVGNPALYGYYQEVAVSTYGELGLAKGLAATLQWTPLRTFLLADPVDGVGGWVSVGEPAVGLRAQPVQAGPFALALQGHVRAPTSSNDPVAPVHAVTDGNPQVGELRIASGVWEFEAGVHVGLGLPKLYLAAYGAAQKRTGGWDSVLLWGIEGGTRLGKKKKTLARVKLYGHHPLGDGDAPYHRSPSGIGNGTRYIAFTLEFDRELQDGWFVGVSLAGGVAPVARQTGGPVIGASFARTF